MRFQSIIIPQLAPLHICAIYNRINILKRLLPKANINQQDQVKNYTWYSMLFVVLIIVVWIYTYALWSSTTTYFCAGTPFAKLGIYNSQVKSQHILQVTLLLTLLEWQHTVGLSFATWIFRDCGFIAVQSQHDSRLINHGRQPFIRCVDTTVPQFRSWLCSIGAGMYITSFLSAGYDLPFIAKHGLQEYTISLSWLLIIYFYRQKTSIVQEYRAPNLAYERNS